MGSPLVSILIPAYKAQFLKEALESAIQQTYHNIEIVVVNDCSPEPLDDIVASFNDTRIKYFKNPKNIGGKDPVTNWNHCITYATGDYFTLLCDDDLYEPLFIEKLLDLTDKYPQCCVFRARARKIDSKGNTIDYYPSCPEWETSADYLIDLEGRYRYQTISEFMLKRDEILRLGGFTNFPKAWLADYQSIAKFGAKNGIVSTQDVLISFRVSGLNISSQEDKNIIEKIIAENKYTQWLIDFSYNLDDERKHILLSHRQIREGIQKSMYLAFAKWKDFFFLWRNRKRPEYKVNSKLFISGVGRKIILKSKRLLGMNN